MTVELPGSARVMRPDLHRVVTKNYPLCAHFDLGERTPGREEVLRLPRCFIVISFDEMNRFAGNLFAKGGYGLRSAHAKVSEEIEHVIRFHRSIQALQDDRVHLLRAHERTIAVANDVEVPKVKVGGEPNIGHHQII